MRTILAASMMLMVPTLDVQLLPHNIPFLCAGSPDNVPAGQNLLLTGTVSKGCIEVPNGSTLTLGSNLNLTVTTIQVLPGGTITAPSVSNSVVTFRDAIPTDPEQYGTGLVVLGAYSMFGEMAATKVRMTAEVAAGATTVQLASTDGMRVGGQIVFGDSQTSWDGHSLAPPQFVTITALTGTSATFTPANATLRKAARRADRSIHTYPHVGYISRGLTFRSANPNGTRAHSIIAGDATGIIDGVAVVDMGRTRNDLTEAGSQQPGRYATHFHHNAQPGTFRNSAIVNSLKWGMSVHQSSNKLIQNNVVVNAHGWCLGTEDGVNETTVTFDGNWVTGCTGDGNRGDRGIDQWATNPLIIGTAGVCYWQAGPLVNWTNNVCVGAFVAGWKTWGQRDDGLTDIGTWHGNECWGGSVCLSQWYTAGGLFEDQFVANVLFGTENYPNWRMTYRRWTVLGDPDLLAAYPGTVYWARGFYDGDYATYQERVEDSIIENMWIGYQPPWAVAGNTLGEANRARTATIINSSLCNNTHDIKYLVHGGSEPQTVKPQITTVAQDNAHCSQSPTWVSVEGELRQNSGDPVPIFEVVNFNRAAGDNFRVYSDENAPVGTMTRPRVLDRVSDSGTPPPPVDTDGDGVTDDIDNCDTVPGPASNGGCPVIQPPPTGVPTTSTITQIAGPSPGPNGGMVTTFQSVEGPNWDTALWGSDTNLFNVVVQGTGPLPVTLYLHGAQNGTHPPDTWIDPGVPGIWIHPVDNAYTSGAIDPVTGTSRNYSFWMGYRDSANVFQPVTMDRVVRYVQWVLTQTQRWTPDPNRVYVKGASMGGGGAQKIALHNPALFAAGIGSTGWVDLSGWTMDCVAGMRWRASTGPLCTDMHDSIYLVNHPQTLTGLASRRPPLFLTWSSNDNMQSPARYPEFIGALEAAGHGHQSEWREQFHLAFWLAGDPWFDTRLNVAATIITPTGTATNQPTGTRTNLGTGAPPPPDADGDGVPDTIDQCPSTAPGVVVGPDGCALPPTDPCIVTPLVVTVTNWPNPDAGSRQIWYNASQAMAGITFTANMTQAVFTDQRGCSATVTR